MSDMNKEELTEKLKSLIEDYEICYKESDYEGNFEEYKSLKETHKLLKDILNLIDRLQKEIDKKDRVIDLMAEYFYGNNWEFVYSTAKEVKEYFYKQADVEDLLKEN